jgi:2-methylcitrate dehydratase PrpD
MNNITTEFLNKINDVFYKKIPDDVMIRTKFLLLDYLCVTLAGAKYNAAKIDNYLNFIEPESGDYTIIGTNRKTTLKEAVFLNGLNAHALDYDDGSNAGIIHLGSPIFSVLLNLLQKRSIDYYIFLKAVILGYETSYTIANTIQPLHKLLGYHATGTCGVLGATIAVSYALDFNEDERKNAFATACISASGMLKVLDDESELKPYNVAKTSLLALTSAQMAKAGYKGNIDALGGNRGFLAMMCKEQFNSIIDPMQNGTYAVEKTYVKPYAACRYCHPSIEAAIYFSNIININDISSIIVKTYSLAVKGHDHTTVPTISSAKMSIPYGIAVGLTKGAAGLNEYTQNLIQNKEIMMIMTKVKVEEDVAITSDFPKRQGAVVIIKTNTREYRKEINYPKGEPENPFSEQEFKDRFIALCLFGGKTVSEAKVIYDQALSDDKNLSSLMDIL